MSLYKAFWIQTSESERARRLLSETFTGPKSRFIAGDTLDEGVGRVRALNRTPVNGRTVNIGAVLDYVGEGVHDMEGALRARDTYLNILDEIHGERLNSTIAIKLTQLGLLVGLDECLENVASIFGHARKYGIWPEIDAEQDKYAQDTLQVHHELRLAGVDNVVIALQSYRRAAEKEARELREKGAAVRIVKGAYKEPLQVAYQRKSEVDAGYVHLMEILMDGARVNGTRLVLGTHDESMIERAEREIERDHRLDDKTEFAMLLGVRNSRLGQLAYDGRRTSVYVPYGPEWFPYFCRRLGERPANLAFVARNLLS